MGDERTIAVAICGHNQRDAVLRTIGAVLAQGGADLHVQVHYVDDGSTDGSSEAVLQEHPTVTVVHGTGDLYWGGGMRAAIDSALQREPDLLLWLNADTQLLDGALHELLASWHQRDGGMSPIVVGATVWDGRITYSGLHRVRGLGLRFRRVQPGEPDSMLDTFNGNIVLMSPATYRLVGGIDPAMPHQMGDLDFGLRARALGVTLRLVPRPLGEVELNRSVLDAPAPPSAGARLRKRAGVKELEPRAWRTFIRRHAGPAWPLLFVKPYLEALVGMPPKRVE